MLPGTYQEACLKHLLIVLSGRNINTLAASRGRLGLQFALFFNLWFLVPHNCTPPFIPFTINNASVIYPRPVIKIKEYLVRPGHDHLQLKFNYGIYVGGGISFG